MSNKNSNWKWSLLAIAASVSATAASASAQDVTLLANVPFAFSIYQGTNLAPGNYVVTRHGSIWRFRSEDSAQSAMIAGYSRVEGKADEHASLTFDCLRGHCQVRAIHVGGGEQGIEVPAPKLSKSDREELAVVNVPLKPNLGQ